MGNYTKMVAIGLIASAAVVTGTSKASADSMVTIRYRAKVGHKVYKIADKRVKKNKIIKYQSKKLIGGYHQKSAVKVKANKTKTVYLAYTNKYKVKYYATKSTVQTGNKYIFNGSKKLAEWERPSLSAFELHYQYDESQFVNGEFGKVGLKVYPYRKTWEKTQDEANKHELEPIINLKQFVNWDLGTQREKFDAVVNEIVEKLESDSFIEKRD